MWIPGSTLGAPALFLAGTASSLHCGLMCGALGVHHVRAAGTLRADHHQAQRSDGLQQLS